MALHNASLSDCYRQNSYGISLSQESEERSNSHAAQCWLFNKAHLLLCCDGFIIKRKVWLIWYWHWHMSDVDYRWQADESSERVSVQCFIDGVTSVHWLWTCIWVFHRVYLIFKSNQNWCWEVEAKNWSVKLNLSFGWSVTLNPQSDVDSNICQVRFPCCYAKGDTQINVDCSLHLI